MKLEYKNHTYVIGGDPFGDIFDIYETDYMKNRIFGSIGNEDGHIVFDCIQGQPQFKKHTKKYIKNLCRLFDIKCDFRDFKRKVENAE